MKKFKQILLTLTLPLLVMVGLFGLIMASPAHAALDNPDAATASVKWDDRPLNEQVQIYQTYLTLMGCFMGRNFKDSSSIVTKADRISVDNANKFQWFASAGFGVTGTFSWLGDNILKRPDQSILGMNIPVGSIVPCGDPATLMKMLKKLGENTSDAIGLMCDSLGFARNGGCGKNGTGDIYATDGQLNILKNRWTSRFWGKNEPLSKKAQYYRYKSLFDLCATPASSDALSGTDRSYLIYDVDDQGNVSEEKVLYYGAEGVGKSRGETVATGGGFINRDTGNIGDVLTFGVVQRLVSTPVGDISNDLLFGSSYDTRTKMSCADLESELNNKSLLNAYAAYVQKEGKPDSVTGSPTDQECVVNPTANGCTTEPTCGNQVSGLGWILCPIIDGLTNLNDAVWGVVSGLLKVSPLRADGSESIYSAWGILRSFANVAFIIVFLLMIFSQLTNFGVSNYGVKKLLPRLLISALLVNLSFVIVQISVDLANILGSGLYDLLTGLSPNGVQPPSWNDLIGNILAGAGGVALGVGGLALAGGVATAFWLLLPVAAMGALSLLAAIFTLIFRQAVIPILAILAPLAFVAYMLPNTETWFKKWRDLMLSMLMLYPLAAVLFGGAQFASTVIMGAGSEGNWWTTLLGLIVLTLPLFALPFLARQGGPLLGKVGGALNNLAQKARNPINNYTKARADMSRERYGAGSPNKANLSRRLFQSAASRNRTVATRTEGYKKEAEENYKKAMVGDPETGDPSKLKGGARRARAAHDRLDFQNLRGENNDAVLSRALEDKKATDPEFRRMVNSTRAHTQAKQTAIDAQTKNYASALDTDPTLLRVAGGRSEVDSAGQIKAKAYGVQAEAELENKNVKAAQVLGGANSEAALQAGIRVAPDGKLGVLQPDGSLVTDEKAVTDAMRAGKVIDPQNGKIEDFSAAGVKSLGNLQEFYTTPFGAQAIASTLAATKQITSKGLTELVDNIQDPVEKAAVVDQLNKELAAAGLDYLGKNTVNADGKFILGGQKGLAPGVVGGILADSGIGGYTKQMMADDEFGPVAAEKALEMLRDPKTTTAFSEGLPNVNDTVLGQLAERFAALYPNDPTYGDKEFWKNDLRNRRTEAIARKGGQNIPQSPLPPAPPPPTQPSP